MGRRYAGLLVAAAADLAGGGQWDGCRRQEAPWSAFARPLDGGALFVDGQPIFGPSKTIRGIVVSVLATSICAALMGLGWEVRNSGRDLCHGRRSLLQLRETQAAPGFKQHGHRPRSHPGVSLPPPRQPVAVAAEHSRHCGRGDDLRCGRADPVAPPFQVESSRRAPLTGDRQLERWKWCRVISGGQLKRTGTTDDPAPTDV